MTSYVKGLHFKRQILEQMLLISYILLSAIVPGSKFIHFKDTGKKSCFLQSFSLKTNRGKHMKIHICNFQPAWFLHWNWNEAVYKISSEEKLLQSAPQHQVSEQSKTDNFCFVLSSAAWCFPSKAPVKIITTYK